MLVDLQDLFQEVGVMQPASEMKQRQTPTPTSGIAIPRPPSRRDDSVTVSLELYSLSIHMFFHPNKLSFYPQKYVQ